MAQRIHLHTGGADSYLSKQQARQLASKLLLAVNAQPVQPILTPIPTSVLAQRSAQVAQQKAAQKATGEVLQFTGKSSFQDPGWKRHALDLAKQRAQRQLEDYKRSLEIRGKSLKGTLKTQCLVGQDGSVVFTITVNIA